MKSKQILIIEDDVDIADDIKNKFENDNEFEFQIMIKLNFQEAEQYLRTLDKRLDVVIIDLELDEDKKFKGFEGFEVLENLATYLPKIKIVFTYHNQIHYCVRAIKAGADDYILKRGPESYTLLLNTVKGYLRKRKEDEHEPDSRYLDQIIEEYKGEKYRGHYLAFIEGKVVGYDKDKEVLISRIQKEHDIKPFIMLAPEEI